MMIFDMDVAEEMSSDKMGVITGNLPDPPSKSKCDPTRRKGCEKKGSPRNPPGPWNWEEAERAFYIMLSV